MERKVEHDAGGKFDRCFGRLSLSSILKVCLILGLGLGILSAAFYLITVWIQILMGTYRFEPIRALKSAAIMIPAHAVGGLILGLFGYPLYALICKKSGGHVLRGQFVHKAAR